MNEDALKQKVQSWIVFFSVLLLAGKFIAFFLTNSVGILTDAMESIVNVMAGFISLYSLRWAARPKDKQHPFGHGKMELISASIEGLLIMVAGGVIIYEGIKRLFDPSQIDKLDIGIVVIAVAGLINYIMGWYSIRIGKKYNSIALISGGKHLQSDTYSTIGLVAGLILLYITGLAWIDSALALLFGLIIIATGISILRKTIANLLDKADNQVLEAISQTIVDHRSPEWIDVHNLKVIRYGSHYYMDCDLTLPWFYNIKQGHQVCKQLENNILTGFSERILVSIHLDFCTPKNCTHCSLSPCPQRKHDFTTPLSLTLDKLTESDEEREE